MRFTKNAAWLTRAITRFHFRLRIPLGRAMSHFGPAIFLSPLPSARPRKRRLQILTPIVSCFFALLLSSCRPAGESEAPSAPTDFWGASCFDVVTVGETVHLLFGQNMTDTSDELSFFYTCSKDAGENWSRPVAVPSAHAPPGRHQRGHDPQLAVSGHRLMALWTAQGDGPWGSGALAVALSGDGGKTWRPGPEPRETGEEATAGYRFPAVTADAKGFHVIWIHALDTARSLRYAELPFGGNAWTTPVVIDPQTCACCWNKLKIGADGSLFALYRDQKPSDMALATSNDRGQTWTRTGPAGDFDWHFNGCPHVGGGLALAPAGPHPGQPAFLATVWTGHPDSDGAYILRSENEGQNWHPSPLPGNDVPGNVNTDIAILPDGRAGIVWDRSTESGARIVWMATSPDAGQTWSPPRALTEETENSTHPRLVPTNTGFLVFWTVNAEDGVKTLFRRSP